METRHFTIGMAGHIDHGKTTLTKALTNIDTDRLKEEKERKISIEPGFAPLYMDENIEVSIIDVPGHERFIRQMIAGVAGIDIVILVVAADESVMPQTKEHLEILTFLGIEKGIIAISKIDRVDEEFIELVKDEMITMSKGTFLEGAPIVAVDSLSKRGIDDLKNEIFKQLETIPHKNSTGAFRLPIDQVFSVHGQGLVLRGTVYEGEIIEGDHLEILPNHLKVRARQIQVHHKKRKKASAGQRAAINIGKIDKGHIRRGDVLVSSDDYSSTTTIDILLQIRKNLMTDLKQRSLVKVHIGTAEILGKIVFFDRNKIDGRGDVLCQVRLETPIVTRRGDRFVLRRPTPVETIGGGMVIDPSGGKYRFGAETIAILEKKLNGTPKELVIESLKKKLHLDMKDLAVLTGIPENELMQVISDLAKEGIILHWNNGCYVLMSEYHHFLVRVKDIISDYHRENPMKQGIQKAQVIQQSTGNLSKELSAFFIDRAIQEKIILQKGPFLSDSAFKPHIPIQWKKRVEHVINNNRNDGLKVKPLKEYFEGQHIPVDLQEEIKQFLVKRDVFIRLDDHIYIHTDTLSKEIERLREGTGDQFRLSEAKEILQVSRKYLILFLELLDHLNVTERQEQMRIWKTHHH